MLIINDSLNKRFCKKVFGFNISLFKKCYVYNIFIINFHNIVKIYYENVVDITIFEKRNAKTKYFFTKSFIKRIIYY